MKRVSGALFSTTLARWIAATVILAALIWVAPYRAFDRQGNPRIRTPPQLWTLVTPADRGAARPAWVNTAYHGALAVTIGGAFVLLWCALRVGRATENHRSPVQQTTTWVAGMLKGGEASRITPRALRWVIAALALFVAWRLGAFLFTQADTFVSVDHPFHIARAETLRRSLLNGEILRWIAHHQGGYPVEFYPLGFAYFEMLVWAALLGLVSMLVVHKIVVILLLVAPAILFWQMARADGRPPIVGLVAFAAHLAVPGSMWEGGFTELVRMGLVTNVTGALCSVASLVALTVFAMRGGALSFALAASSAAAAIWTNPRSGLGLLACGIGVWLALAWMSRGRNVGSPAAKVAGRLALVAGAAALLAAPELLSLVRYGGLYYFIQYTAYNTATQYLAASINAVSVPVFAFAILGGWAALAADDRPIARATAITLIVYVVFTSAVSFSPTIAKLVPQLEATRLMPLQRFLTLYLAAVGCHVAARALTHGREARAADALQLGSAAAILLAFGIPIAIVRPAAEPEMLARSTDPAMVRFTEVVKLADRLTPRENAVFIVGSSVSTHQQLWAPVVAERPYFYNDWMWYWHTRHVGPYSPTRGSVYRSDRMAEVLSRRYLDRHAIGSVLVAGPSARLAAFSPDLQLVFSGTHSLYTVRNPVPFVTFASAPTRVTVSNHHIDARGESPGGFAIVRRNWFPRWRATVNDRAASIERTRDGYMRVAVPAGPVHLRLDYAVETLDWVGRAAACAGLVVIAAAVATRRRAMWRAKDPGPAPTRRA